MKSSGAVFTRQNPFPRDPPFTRTHYNPSPTKKIPKQQRKMVLSPVRLAQPSSPPEPPSQTASLSPEDQRFLGESNHLVLCPLPSADCQPSFSESWPSTDLGSSPANTTTSPNTDALGRAAQSRKTPGSAADGDQEDSVLAKYIERFRHGRPQSREERQRLAAMVGQGRPFWWMSSSPPQPTSSTPTPASEKGHSSHRNDCTATSHSPIGRCRHGTSLSPGRGLLDLSVLALSDDSHCDPGELDVLQLQERASRLLRRSEHSLSSGSIPISSEGLGCSDFSSPVSADEPVRRPVVSCLIDSDTALVNPAALRGGPVPTPSVVGPLAPRTRPEEDILFQWRLRRKMEQARHWSQTPSQNSALLLQPAHQMQHGLFPTDLLRRVTPSFTPAPQVPPTLPEPPGPAATPSLPISSPTVSKLPPETRVQAHAHLLCDIQPCPLRPSPRKRSPKRQEVPRRARRQPEAQARSTGSSEVPASKHESSPPPELSESTEEEWQVCRRRGGMPTKGRVESEGAQKQTAPSSRKKKSTRHSGGGDHVEKPARTDRGASRGQDRVARCTEESSRDAGRHDEGQRSTGVGRPGDQAPPPSPIHSALGQVVSEVLFPAPDSPSHPRTPCSSDSPQSTPPAPPQSPAPPPSMQQPSEVIAQLLQEAEDSDGLEFEDDPLLQVLRQQRGWVKDQISEVDTILDELQED